MREGYLDRRWEPVSDRWYYDHYCANIKAGDEGIVKKRLLLVDAGVRFHVLNSLTFYTDPSHKRKLQYAVSTSFEKDKFKQVYKMASEIIEILED